MVRLLLCAPGQYPGIQVPLRDVQALLAAGLFSFSASTVPTPDAVADLCCATPGHLHLCRWQMISFSLANSNQGEHQTILSCCSPSRQWKECILPPVYLGFALSNITTTVRLLIILSKTSKDFNIQQIQVTE